ncbi:hypothetical protein [Corynebacterium flavescens]|uniref:hypothetical protein n=1 Tax=Corynebacterium flavescens TaxID=28028 RepID=UPI0026476641|nr:hypothetical protein [Corynebacterium flavescens]MDN6822933.1 hypothetical protein [Corynebacterium flavescens]
MKIEHPEKTNSPAQRHPKTLIEIQVRQDLLDETQRLANKFDCSTGEFVELGLNLLLQQVKEPQEKQRSDKLTQFNCRINEDLVLQFRHALIDNRETGRQAITRFLANYVELSQSFGTPIVIPPTCG